MPPKRKTEQVLLCQHDTCYTKIIATSEGPKREPFSNETALKNHYKTVPHFDCAESCPHCLIYGRQAKPNVKFGCRHSKCQMKYHEFGDKYRQKKHERGNHIVCGEGISIDIK